MLLTLADHAMRLAAPAWDHVIVPLFTFLIYGILGPAVYLLILIAGIDLAWPGGTSIRKAVSRRQHPRTTNTSSSSSAAFEPPAESPTSAGPIDPAGATSSSSSATLQPVATDPTGQIRRAIGGLIALAVLSTVITLWLAGYPADMRAPLLSTAFSTSTRMIFFLFMLVLGFAGGALWTTGMRTARTARAALIVLAVSMSLSSTLVFFYIVESGLRDLLLVIALGIFSGELYVAAQHPTLMSEGLFAELLRPAAPEVAHPVSDDDTLSSSDTPDDDDDEWRAQTPIHSYISADTPPTDGERNTPTPPPPVPPAGAPPPMDGG